MSERLLREYIAQSLRLDESFDEALMGTAVKAFKAGKKSGEAAGQAMIAGEFGGAVWNLGEGRFTDWVLVHLYGEHSEEGRRIINRKLDEEKDTVEERLRINGEKLEALNEKEVELKAQGKSLSEKEANEKKKLEANQDALEARLQRLEEKERKVNQLVKKADKMDAFIKDDLKPALHPSALKKGDSQVMKVLKKHIRATGAKSIKPDTSGVKAVFNADPNDENVFKFFNKLAEEFKVPKDTGDQTVLDHREVRYIQRKTKVNTNRLS